MRVAGMANPESERQLDIAAGLVRYDPDHSFSVRHPVDQNELWYCLGRVDQLVGRKQLAKDIFERIADEHEDARAALAELTSDE